jgi:hypothetical protein
MKIIRKYSGFKVEIKTFNQSRYKSYIALELDLAPPFLLDKK